MKKLLLIVLLILIGRYLYVNNFQKEEWVGYFYPDSTNLSNWIESDETFGDIDSCRDWVYYQMDIAMQNNPYFYEEDGNYDYECGLNCELKYGMNVCKETIQ